MPSQPRSTVAVVYARISHDAEGEALGVQRQVDDCTALAESLGLTVLRVYADNDVSASTNSKKARPEYQAMLAAVRAAEASTIVAYSNSRLTRRPRELEDLIDLHAETGVSIKTVVSGYDDLSTADGRMVARIKANVDTAEAERASERIKRQKQQRLNSGMPPGSRYRTFGYSRDWQVIEEEVRVVKDVFTRVAAGESVNSITKDLRGQGIETVSGKPWTFQATSRVLDSPIYAGLLTYKGEIVGKSSVSAIVSEALYQSAQSRQTKPAWNTRKHLLSGIAVCDVCKTPMNYSQGAYVCSRMMHGCGNIRIKAKWLDDVVNAYMSSMVMNDAQRRQDDAPQDEQPDPAAEIDRQIAAARQANIDGDLDLADLLPMLKELRARRADAVKRQVQAVEVANWQPVADYDQADLSVKRSIVRRHIEAIMVMPAKRGLNRFDETRCYVLLADGRKLPLAAINVLDYRELIPGYVTRYPIEERGAARD